MYNSKQLENKRKRMCKMCIVSVRKRSDNPFSKVNMAANVGRLYFLIVTSGTEPDSLDLAMIV